MIVQGPNGRPRSVRTAEEEQARLLADWSRMDDEQKALVATVLRQIGAGQTPSLIKAARMLDYEEEPVSPRTFYTNEYFIGEMAKELYPQSVNDLVEIFEGGYDEVIISGAIGIGKAQPLTAKVLTPAGWKLMRDVKVGDRLVDPDGGTTRVVGVFPQGKKPVYRVTFSDGASAECCDDHLWEVSTPKQRSNGAPGRVIPLREIRKRIHDAGGRRQYFIPMVRPVEHPQKALPLDPYLVGVLLGDGGLTQGSPLLISADAEALAAVSAALPERVGHSSASDYRLSCGQRGGATNPLIGALRDIGLTDVGSSDKFIPEPYLTASREQREGLLQGLFDTNGSPAGGSRSRPGSCVEFCTTSYRLAQDVRALVQSLGGTARLEASRRRKLGKPSWRLVAVLPADVQPFRLRRKLDRYRPGTKYGPSRSIESVTPIGEAECQCIQVSSKRGLYVTDDYVVTHNTTSGVLILLRMLYESICLRNPQRTYGLLSGAKIHFAVISATAELAQKVVFESLVDYLRGSPWFQQRGFQAVRDEIRFPKNIRLLGGASSDRQLLGMNVFGGLIDECVTSDTRVLTPDGYRQISDMLAEGAVAFPVTGLDLETGRLTTCTGFLRETTVADVFDVVLSDGKIVTATAEHPFLVRTSADGDMEYVFLRDLRVGDEVVVINGEGQAWEQERTFREEAYRRGQAENLGSTEGTCDQRGNAQEDVRSGEASLRSTIASCLLATGRKRREESVLWLPTHCRDQAEDRCSTSWNDTVGRNASEEGGRSSRQEAASGSLREDRSSEQEAKGGVQTLGGIEAQDLSEQCVEAREGELPLHGARGDVEGWERGLQVFLREACDQLARLGRERFYVFLRAVEDSLQVGREATLHSAGLSGGDDERHEETHRGRAVELHEQPEGAREGTRTQTLLQVARSDVRDLARRRTVARVVEIRSAGRRQTYDLTSEPCGNFIANGVVVHNSNFRRQPGRKKAEAIPGQNEPVDSAEQVYSAIKQRMKSRFLKTGKLPGVLCILSSKNKVDDFIERRIREAKTDPNVFYREYALWDVNRSAYSEKTFRVLVGNELIRSRILEDNEMRGAAPEGCKIVEVPEDFRADFARDINNAIRNLAGISTIAKEPFIPMREKLALMIDRSFRHPFGTESWTYGYPLLPKWELLFTTDEEGFNTPICCPDAPRHAHLDLSKNHCATGFAVGHICGQKRIRRIEGNVHVDRTLPVVRLDVVLQVLPPNGEEIILTEVVNLVYELVRQGMPIHSVSMDTFQSLMAIQRLRADGFIADNHSNEKKGRYEEFKQAIYDGRVLVYEYRPLMKELQELERDPLTGKVVPPPNGFKDVADAASCVVTWLNERAEYRPPQEPQKGISQVIDKRQVSASAPTVEAATMLWDDELQDDQTDLDVPFILG